ncbi:hypothetical protein [Acinetobacter junii]|uniref:hypothetical protein n=1 Tax=Acinetobacter junii TaxID=40215 RepID=UPI0032125DE7
MNEIIANPIWSLVRVLEEMELAYGGINGNMNEQAQQLANRTEFLKLFKADIEYVDFKVSGVSGGHAGSFLTYAAMDAAKATLPNNCSVKVSNDPDNNKNGEYTWNGTIFTKSAYDPLAQAIAYFNSNPNFKPVQIVSGNNFNNFTQPGVYFHWGANISETQVLNAPLYVGGNLAFGVLIVYNANPTGAKNPSTHQIFYPYNDGYAPFFRKVRQSNSEFGSWSTYITKENQFKLDTITAGVDVLTLIPGRYGIPSLEVGNSLINMPNMPYKFGRIEVDFNANSGYKTIKIFPYGRDTNTYENKNYELNVWSGWRTQKDYESFKAENDALYASKNLLSTSIAEALGNITQDSFFGKQYTTEELTSTNIYPSAYYLGYNQVTGSKAATFNAIKARFWNPGGGEVQYRIFYGSKVTEGTNGAIVPQANVNSPNYSGICKTCPTSDTGLAQDIVLDQVINIPANTPFVIVFRDSDLTTLRCGFASAATGNLVSRGFTMWANPVQWGESNIAVASPSLNYIQAGFQLIMKLPTSDSGTTPIQPTYKPTLVLPAKVYAMEGLQTHIYPEHLLVEKSELYEHNITCSRGRHMERGFLWEFNANAPDPVGNYPLTWELLDAQTDASLTAASTTLQIVDKNAKSGQTLNVSFIADSLGASGTITQRLLDIAANDVTKVNLIGTRGTGLNKHEGRGGWTINDYSGVGRTYYSFTVSGVTTTPAINATTYTFNGTEFLVQETYLTNGAGTIVCNINTGAAPAAGSSGTLAKKNTSAGDNNIVFTDVQPLSANPFWNAATNSLDYAGYLNTNGFVAPDIVFIQLGINDTFGLTTDGAVKTFCETAFAKLDQLIASIKAANANTKVVLMTPPSYASQDAFGFNYACGQTSRRAKRNIITYNQALLLRYSGLENQRIHTLGSGVNVDTQFNFPSGQSQVNSHNLLMVTRQTNGVHPDTPGYRQIADFMFIFIKAV